MRKMVCGPTTPKNTTKKIAQQLYHTFFIRTPSRETDDSIFWRAFFFLSGRILIGERERGRGVYVAVIREFLRSVCKKGEREVKKR